MPEGGWVTATWARQCPADALSFAITSFLQAGIAHALDVIAVARVGVEPTEHEGLSFAALPDCVPCQVSVLDGI